MSLLNRRQEAVDGPEKIYTMKTENGRGRCIVLAHVVINQVISWLTTGMFYTSFLMIYGIDIVNVGIVTFVPYIASCFGIFSPVLLERFQKRKIFLGATRALYYILNILGITLIPVMVTGERARIAALVAVVFLSNIVNALTGSGYTVWHIKFVPPSMRADYFSIQSLIANTIGIGASLASGIVADLLASSPYQNAFIIALRYIGFAFAVLDVVLLCLPKEFSYEHSKAPRLKDIFTLPFHSKPFMMTMAVSFLFTFFTAIPSSSLNYYLLNTVGVEYTFVYAINFVYPIIQLFLLPLAKKYVNKHGWFATFAVFVFATFPTFFLYSFIGPGNYLWVLPTVRIIQHFFGTYYNLANSNLIYTNLPREDQTNYLSFQSIVSNAASFLGMMVGTGFVAWFGSRTVALLGFHFDSVQMLLWGEGIGYILLPIFIFLNLKVLTTNNN